MSDKPTLQAETLRLTELGLLAAALVHELRQPLFAARALVQMAAGEGGASPRLREVLEQLDTMDRLIAGYGDFSRKPRDQVEIFDVRAPLESARHVLHHRARALGVELRVDTGEAAAVRGSALALQQAVVNLGQNAIEAVGHAPERRVDIQVRRAGTEVRVEVRDSGPGVHADVRQRLFTPFVTTKPQGTGLGLWLTREMIVAAGGRLLLEEEGGTCWAVVLPRVGGD